MKVSELIKQLEKMPQDRMVLYDTGRRNSYGCVIFSPIDGVYAGFNELDGAVILEGQDDYKM